MVDLVYSAITWNANICRDFLQAWIKIPATFTDFDQPSSELLLAALQVKNAKLPPNESDWSVGKKPAIVCHDIQAIVQLRVTFHVQAGQTFLVWTAPPTIWSTITAFHIQAAMSH